MSSEKKPVGFATHMTAGGIAGAMEAVRILSTLHSPKNPDLCHLTRRTLYFQLCCQPLDTIKVRMQLSRSGRLPGVRISPRRLIVLA